MRLFLTTLLLLASGLAESQAAQGKPQGIPRRAQISLDDLMRGATQRGKPGGLFSGRGIASAPLAPPRSAPPEPEQAKIVPPRKLIQQIAKPLRLTARQRSRLLTKLEWRTSLGTTPRAPEDDPATIDAILSVLEPDQAQAFLRLLGPDRVNKLRERTVARKRARRGMPVFHPARPQPKLQAVAPRREPGLGGFGGRGGRGREGRRGGDLEQLLRESGGGGFFF